MRTELEEAVLVFESDYRAAPEHHNPMQSHATTAVWEGDGKITVRDKIQGVSNTHQYITNVFGLSADDVRMYSPFVGAAFGSGLCPQYQLFRSVMATPELKRSVRVNEETGRAARHPRGECRGGGQDPQSGDRALQVIGGVVFGRSMARTEESLLDQNRAVSGTTTLPNTTSGEHRHSQHQRDLWG